MPTLVADLSGPLIRPIQQSAGSGPALTLPPGHLSYGIVEPSIVPKSVSDALKNPLFIAGAVLVAFLILR